MMRILVLGGTTEARLLAGRLADMPGHAAIVSLAGRTVAAVEHAVPVRTGGFGGAAGLADYLRAEHIDALIDATHPYAAVISENAAAAAKETGTPLLALRRPPWRAVAGDRWTEIGNIEDAVVALGTEPRRIFLALGRQEIAAFEAAPRHFYLVRSVDPVEPPLSVPDAFYVVARGPFTAAGDRALLKRHRIDLIVSRNSGGDAAYGKIAAGRDLGIEVLLLGRPPVPDVTAVASVEDALAWLVHADTLPAARGA